jgi:hypothetical protein
VNRRDWFKGTFAGGALLAVGGSEQAMRAAKRVATKQIPPAVPASASEIYELLGFATMTGEDPLKMWERLRETEVWRVGPLSPDSWSGSVFIADDSDIFAFRTLSIPRAWMQDYTKGNRAEYSDGRFETWWKSWPGVEERGSPGKPGWWSRVGPKAWDNSYAHLSWQMPDGGPFVTYEWAQTDKDQMVGRITHSSAADLVLQAYAPWDSSPPQFAALYSDGPSGRFVRGRSWVPGTRDGLRWVLALSESAVETHGTGTGRWHGYFPGITKLYFCGQQGQKYASLEEEAAAWDGPRIDRLLETNLERYQKARPKGGGWLDGAPDAINDTLEWGEVYTPLRKRTYITVSRKWAQENNSAPDFHWDSFFNGLLVCQEDEKKAFDMIRDITSWQNDQGMFCQYGQWVSHPDRWIFPVAWGHSQYPIGSLVVAKIYLRRPNKDFLAEIYPRLLRNQRWWFADRGDGQPWRDGNKNGLLELGSNYPEEIPYKDRQQCAYFESNDDSPQWHYVAPYNPHTQTLEQDTVERNCLYGLDCWVLAWMANELGKHHEAAALAAENRRIANDINRLLWDTGRQCYFNRHWDNHPGDPFFTQIGPDIFFSLLGRVASPEQSMALRKIFHDPEKFAGEWILPTISRDDPAFPTQDYWRGKVWPPHNWLIYQGLKMYEWDHEARLLAESSAKMFFKAWRKNGECHENFSSITGEGTGQSDPHYTWGALMPLIAIEELIDINPWQGLRFGNLDPVAEAGIERYSVAGSLYDVFLSLNQLEVRKDGRFLLATDSPAEVRHVNFENGRMQFELRASHATRLRVGNGASREYGTGVSKDQLPL